MSRRSSTLLVLVLVFSSQALAQKLPPWDVGLTAQPGQATVYLSNMNGGDCGIPVELGDYDDDGFLDYAIAPILADSGPTGNRANAGEIIVIKGNGTVGGVINMAAPPAGQPLLRIYGAATDDLVGTEMYSADINNDGISDLILGASGADPNGIDRAGAVYVIYGGTNFNGIIDLATPPSWITIFEGKDQADRLGFWVEAGDINGDNIDDLLMSADDGNGVGNAHTDRGEAYVVYGGQAFPPVVDLNSLPPGLQMVTIYGIDDGDQLGSTMHSVDLDNDGFEEIIVSAALNRAIGGQTGTGSTGGDGPSNSRTNCGDTYIIWGANNLPPVIDLATSAAAMLASNELTIIYGADDFDFLGEEQSSGNIDGDAYNDLILGAITADGFNNNSSAAGDAFILWGGPQLRGQTIDADLLPAGTTTLHGEHQGDIGADTLSVADVNNDGFDDVYFSMPNGDPLRPGGSVNNAGEILVLFGGPVRWPTMLKVGDMAIDTDYPTRRVWGNDALDLMGYSMEGGDFDDDGFAEIFPNSMRADGFNNLFPNAGEVAIVSGHEFSKGLTTLVTPPTLGTTLNFSLVGEPGHTYVAAFALSMAPAQTIPGIGTLHLANDFLFQLSLTAGPPFFGGMSGVVAPGGKASYSLFAPNLGALLNTRIFTAYVTIDPSTSTLDIVSGTTSFVLN